MDEEDRIIWGAAAIAVEINNKERQTRHLLVNGRLPAVKIGDQWVSTRNALRNPTTWPKARKAGAA